MRIVLQRVSEAAVKVEGQITSQIQNGFLILMGIEHEDDADDVEWLVNKVMGMRVFSDEEGKMNRNIQQIEKGAFLVISQFTLHASTKKGNRPSFIRAARPDQAIPLYEAFVETLAKRSGLPVETGVFGADMKVQLINDGPVTIIMDSKNKE